MVSMSIRCSLHRDDNLLEVRQGDREESINITDGFEEEVREGPGRDHESDDLH